MAPFPITPEVYEKLKLNEPGAVWPEDPAVPKLPPLPSTDDTPPSRDNYLATHAGNGVFKPKLQMSPPLTAPVTEANPLKAMVIWSMRSPYSYLVLQRLVWLHSNYNVDIDIRPVMPIAVRSTKGGSGKAGGVFGVWYKLTDTQYDTVRTGEYQGVAFPHWAVPDPIWQVTYPFQGENYQYVFPADKQPYIHWITRLAAYAQLKGKSLDYVAEISTLIWSGEVPLARSRQGTFQQD